MENCTTKIRHQEYMHYKTVLLNCFNDYLYMYRGIWGCTACKDYVQQKRQRTRSVRRPDAGTNW